MSIWKDAQIGINTVCGKNMMYICHGVSSRRVCRRGVILKLGIGFSASASIIFNDLKTVSMHITRLALLHHQWCIVLH